MESLSTLGARLMNELDQHSLDFDLEPDPQGRVLIARKAGRSFDMARHIGAGPVDPATIAKHVSPELMQAIRDRPKNPKSER